MSEVTKCKYPVRISKSNSNDVLCLVNANDYSTRRVRLQNVYYYGNLLKSMSELSKIFAGAECFDLGVNVFPDNFVDVNIPGSNLPIGVNSESFVTLHEGIHPVYVYKTRAIAFIWYDTQSHKMCGLVVDQTDTEGMNSARTKFEKRNFLA